MAKGRKKNHNLYASLLNISDFKPEFEEFQNLTTFELKKIERSDLLHFEAQISNFLKMTK